MEIHNLPKTVSKKKRRLGMGHGSGRGKTAGRGTKGQKARGKIPAKLGLAGVALIRRLPLYRGKLRNKVFKKKALVVNVKFLNLLPEGSVIDLDTLIKNKIIPVEAKKFAVKILGDGEIQHAYTVKLKTSTGARHKIEAAGGKVVYE